MNGSGRPPSRSIIKPGVPRCRLASNQRTAASAGVAAGVAPCISAGVTPCLPAGVSTCVSLVVARVHRLRRLVVVVVITVVIVIAVVVVITLALTGLELVRRLAIARALQRVFGRDRRAVVDPGHDLEDLRVRQG